MTTGLRNADQGKPPTLNIRPPSDICHVANVEKHEGKDQTNVTSFNDFTKYIIKSNETKPMYSEKFRPKVKKLKDIPYNGVGTPESTVTVNANSSTSKDSWKHDLAKCLAISKTLTTLHLTINRSSPLEDYFISVWALDMGYGLAESTTLTTLHLTINNHSSTLGDFWAYGLGYGLAESTTLTTLHLTINSHSSTLGSDWVHALADGLANSTSLSTLHITTNDIDMSRDNKKNLAKGLATLRELLTAITLTVNHHDAMDETTGSSDSDHWVKRLKSTPSATPTLSSAAKLTSRFCPESSSLASHHLTTMGNAMSEYVEQYPACSPAKLRKSLPALDHAVDYYDPLDEISCSQVFDEV